MKVKHYIRIEQYHGKANRQKNAFKDLCQSNLAQRVCIGVYPYTQKKMVPKQCP